MSMLTSWSPFFQSSVRMRGRAYQNEDRVHRLEPVEDELVRAEVQGQTETYLVVIRSDEGRAEAECTCPHFESGVYCKHIWATLLDVQENAQAPGVSPDELANLRVRAPKARKRSADDRRPLRSVEPEWVGRLSLLRPPAYESEADASAALPPQQKICYVILPEASQRHHSVVVELRQRTPTVTGWSKPRPIKINANALADLPSAADRELCALLLGGSQVDLGGSSMAGSRSSSTYRLPAGAWRSLLKQMIDTGQCFVDLDEDAAARHDQPLTWDGEEPWVLWMVGREDDSGEELHISVELRRKHEHLPVEKPLLLLGGPDGLVIWNGHAAPFDDRDALRWASQFRDDFRRQDEPRPIRVPRADLDRFLDRLYMLPQLPEIDLPEGVGRVPQNITPTPHLDLFSPGSKEAVQVLPASAKNQLLARVWFDYHHQRINPGQPGRFVTISSAASRTDADVLDANVLETDAATADMAPQADPSAPGSAGGSTGEGSTGEGSNRSADSPTHVDAEQSDLSDQVSKQALDQASGQASTEAFNSGVTPVVAGNGQNHPSENNGNGSERSAGHAGPGEPDQPQGDEAPLPTEGLLIRRDQRGERQALATLASLGLRPVTNAGPDALMLPTKQMPHVIASLLSEGWQVSADRQAVRHAGAPSFSIASGIDWFELHGGIRFQRQDGQIQEVPLPEVLAAARSGKKLITLGDGSQGLLPENWLEEHGLLTSLGKVEGDHLRFKNSQAAVLDALLDEQELVQADEPFRRLRQHLHEFQGVQPLDPSTEFHGQLRPYQRQGLGWLAFLRWFGMGGILADDMGLGKTIQVLAVLQARRLGLPEHSDAPVPATHAGAGHSDETDAEPSSPPSLVVAPRSVVFNWVDEAQRFTPELRVLAYTGTEREAQREAFDEYDLIVTSYGLLRRDIAELREYPFDYVVLDEAQAIKNPTSQAAKAARLLTAGHRLALTGTPVENHLGDLWSIFEFLNPGMLGSGARFAQLLRAASSNGHGHNQQQPDTAQQDAIAQIARALRPFILRRTKKQVLDDLPEKTEQTIVCQMEPPQRKVYDDLRQYYRSHLFQQLDAGGSGDGGGLIGGSAGFMVLEALLRLRQAACHPGLIDEKRREDASAKLDVLLELLADIIEEDSKALIFSQFTSMLALVRAKLDERGVRYAYLDGQTRNRRQVVQQFQEDPEIPVFLISLKTGGFGLNLTAAEYVFILDPWWNPAVEQQAIDRTHRIGQTRRVFAYRLVCEDTVEQRIAQLQQRKREIAEAVVGGSENVLRHLTREDLEQLLS